MDSNMQSSPDLQSILATLAQFATPQAPQTPDNAASTGNESDANAYQFSRGEPQPPPALITKPVDPRLKAVSRPTSASPSPKPIDPATITTWQEGLRCVTKIAAQNTEFAAKLRRMMQDQRTHEMRWYSERQNMKQMHANRSSSAAKAQSILQSLGNSFVSLTPPETSEADMQNELAQFDQKIYAAQQAMEVAMTAELKGLGVPFFGTDRNLVVPDDTDVSTFKTSEDHPKWSSMITESQLLNLRRRMVSHLEDLYRD